MTLINGCKLTYFKLPGRGEATRLALTIGSVPFEDERIEFSQWKEMKSTTPWGSLPVLALSNKTTIAQQRAILRLVGKETNLYPTDDHVVAAKIDELMDAAEDIGSKTFLLGQGLSNEEKEAARKAGCEEGGVTHGILTRIDNYIAMNGTKGFTVGDSMTIADLYVYTSCNNLVSGLFDGVPSDAIDSFPNILAVRKSVRSHPAVSKYYDENTFDLPASYSKLE